MSARVPTRGLDVELDLATGECVAILGPNGAGKSTLLAAIAGILRPAAGRAQLGDTVLFDCNTARRAWLPPHARGVALLAQDPLLFPHLSVLDNVAFGPRAVGQGRRHSRETARRWLEEVGAVEFADRRPAELSGGEAQRVAIARALAVEPRLLLLDEPMAALDVAAAPLLRRVLRRVLAGRSALVVTHDLLDALLLASRVVVIEDGRIVDSGPVEEVIQRPRTAFIAGIAGLNLVRGIATGATTLRAERPTAVPADAIGHLDIEGVPSSELTMGAPALAVFHPTAVAVYVDPPHGSPRNVLPVTVTELEPREALVRVRARDSAGHTLLADVTATSVRALDLYPGRDVHLTVKATAVTIYPG